MPEPTLFDDLDEAARGKVCLVDHNEEKQMVAGQQGKRHCLSPDDRKGAVLALMTARSRKTPATS